MLLYPNAKVNLGLNVTERRPDGYHNIETIFLPIALHDELEIVANGKEEASFSQTDGYTLDCADTDNLIVRTWQIFSKAYGIGGVDIQLKKLIPFGAGLGGGSSDAAHTALALNELFDLQLSKQQLMDEVSQLGADCAFFIQNTPCYAEGIGDKLSPIEVDTTGYSMVLVKPDVHVSTKAAYSGVKAQHPKENLRSLVQLPVSAWTGKIVNDFERSVFAQFPTIETVKAQLYDMGATYASMTGSGASVFALFPKEYCPDRKLLASVFADCLLLSC